MISLEVKTCGEALVVSLIDSSLDDYELCTRVGAELMSLVDQAETTKILLDLANVEYMSSSMVGHLFVVSKRCKARQVKLKACRVAGLVRKVFNIVRLDNFIEIYEDEQSALESFDQDTAADDFQNGERIAELRAAAEADNAEAQFELAQCFDEARGVEQDFEQALQWFQAAAENGHAGAQYQLGKTYAYGIHVKQDYDQALQWYRKAADQGHMEAEYAMGMSYNYGIGVDDNREQAASWYQRAAEQGHERARKELEQLAD